MRHLIVTDSEIIHSVGYDSGSGDSYERETLEVVFKSSPNDVYRYEGVTEKEFVALVTAESIGKAFHEAFRKTKKPFTKSTRSTLKKSDSER